MGAPIMINPSKTTIRNREFMRFVPFANYTKERIDSRIEHETPTAGNELTVFAQLSVGLGRFKEKRPRFRPPSGAYRQRRDVGCDASVLIVKFKGFNFS